MTTGIHKGEVEHKYDYAAVLAETPAYGWTSSRKRVGLWLINPSQEYIGGGPTKTELTGHLDVNDGGLPTLVNMWLGSHYGGTHVSVAANEEWTKVVGPFAIYCNTTDGHDALWRDALARAETEKSAWPYEWAVDKNFPGATERASLAGKILLRDRYEPDAKMSNVWVGVSAPDYVRASSTKKFINSGFPPEIDWQRDAKFYQFWARADDAGNFAIHHVRADRYTLHVIADGVMGEFALTNVMVGTGEVKNLGELPWQPKRFGSTLWQIGIPNRAATEFRHGDDYWHWGLYFDYQKEFPNDVEFFIGRSDWSKDWNYVQPPRILSREVEVVGEEDESGPQLPRDGLGNIHPTTWKISFVLTNQPTGQATLRLAFCGTHRDCEIRVSVNGKPAGDTGPLPATSAMQRDGIRAYWVEKDIGFDARWLRNGTNVVELFSPARRWSQGVMYDCVRLELID